MRGFNALGSVAAGSFTSKTRLVPQRVHRGLDRRGGALGAERVERRAGDLARRGNAIRAASSRIAVASARAASSTADAASGNRFQRAPRSALGLRHAHPACRAVGRAHSAAISSGVRRFGASRTIAPSGANSVSKANLRMLRSSVDQLVVGLPSRRA